MKEEILSIASDLREGSITTSEAQKQLLLLFSVRQSLHGDTYTEIDIDKAYKCGERQLTFYKNNGTVILPRNYEGVDG
jgi:hypothetical protein